MNSITHQASWLEINQRKPYCLPPPSLAETRACTWCLNRNDFTYCSQSATITPEAKRLRGLMQEIECTFQSNSWWTIMRVNNREKPHGPSFCYPFSQIKFGCYLIAPSQASICSIEPHLRLSSNEPRSKLPSFPARGHGTFNPRPSTHLLRKKVLLRFPGPHGSQPLQGWEPPATTD